MKIPTWQKILSAGILLVILSYTMHIKAVFAGPQSTTYELKDYGFGAGGNSGVDSTSYSLFGTVGEIDNGKLDSTTYTTGNGLIFTMISHVPAAPTFTNPSSNYDRLKFIIDNGGNPTDTTFAIGISDDNFVTTRYIQDDNTVGTTLGSEDWQTYTNWGSSSGEYVTGLNYNISYKIKVKAKQGNFTESPWSAESSAASTVSPTLTFGIDSSTLSFSNLNSGNSYTDSSKSTILTTSTNAYNGYIVYGRDTQPLTHITDGSKTIANYASGNSSPTTWTGTGLGYSTDDSSLTGGTGNRFTSGGPKYAGFGTSAPGDPVADHPGPITTAISNENFTISYRVTADANTTAGTYRTTVLYVVVPTY